jgi:hypothetical protein
MCNHEPRCPSARDADRTNAHRSIPHPDQGWALLCNGVILFDDGGLLLPTGEAIPAPVPGAVSAHRRQQLAA